ncbi:hypothetical protein Tco_1402973 [Tanacetum coccineum]
MIILIPCIERPYRTGGSSSAAAPEVSAPAKVEPESVVPEDTYLDLTGPDEVVLRKDHPSLATGTGGKNLAGLRQLMPTSPLVLRPFFQTDIQAHVIQRYLNNVGVTPTLDVAGSSQLETSEGSADSFYELPTLNSAEAGMFLDGTLLTTRCWMTVFPAACWLTALPPSFFSTLQSMDYEQLYIEFNVGAAWQICLESEEKDLEILILKSLLVDETEKAERAENAKKAERAKTAEVVRLRGQVSALTGEVSALKSTIAQKDTDISLLDSRATYLKSALADSKAACAEAGSLITSLTSERGRLTSELDVLKCFKSLKYQGILGHALGRTVDFGMREGLEAGYEHGVAETPLSAVEAYNPEAARTNYFDAVRALENVDFPLVNLLKSKKDAGMDEVLDCFILDGPLDNLPEAAHLQPCLKHLFVPIYDSDNKAIVGETYLSFALLNVHSRAERAKKHDAALRQLMMEIVSNPLSSQTCVGETSTSAAPLFVEDFDEVDTDEALGSVVAIPKFEACHF